MKVVLPGGAGAMGRVTVRDLMASPKVEKIVVADINLEAAQKLVSALGDKRLEAMRLDVRDTAQAVKQLTGLDVMINCAQYYFNMEAMEIALGARLHYIDLGGLFHMTRKQLELHDRFKSADLLAVLGVGSTPGITNVMAAWAAESMEKVISAEIKVGAIDRTPSNGKIAAPYSMHTILDECTKNPMIFEAGKFQEMQPFDGLQEVVFPDPVGRAMAHYTLHSEVATFPLTWKDKEIQRASFRIAFPADFSQLLHTLVDLGLADTSPIQVRDVTVSPRDVLLALLGPAGTPDGVVPDDCDVLRAEVHGMRDGRGIEQIVETVVYPHREWG
ncbi:MAG: saccharopine dehydrogenase family protein, partial [Candidatus Xenobia bacterium]